MSEQDESSSEPPRSTSIVSSDRSADVNQVKSRREHKGRVGRRGRPSREDYRQQVDSIVRADVWDLDKLSVFGSYPGVRTLIARYEHEYLPLGVALKRLLNRAVTDLIPLDWARAYLMLGEVEQSVQEGREFYRRTLLLQSPSGTRSSCPDRSGWIRHSWGSTRVAPIAR